MFDAFEAICVINLAERRDRRRETEAELARVGCTRPVQFFSAIKTADASGFASPGEHGCCMSHMAVLRAHQHCESVLILEDDVRFSDDFAERSRLVEQLPADWDVFYAGWRQLDYCREDWPQEGLVPARPLSEFVGMHCYAVKGSAIPRLLDRYDIFLSREKGHPEGGRIAVDGMMNLARRQLRLATYLTVPPLAVQRASRSDIADLKWFDRQPVVRDAVKMVRSFRNRLTRGSVHPPSPDRSAADASFLNRPRG